MSKIICSCCGKKFIKTKECFIGLCPSCTIWQIWYIRLLRACPKNCKNCKIKISCKLIANHYKNTRR